MSEVPLQACVGAYDLLGVIYDTLATEWMILQW